MQSLNARTATLEASIGVSGKRPAGMSDREFLRYRSEMPPAQHKLFMAAMSTEDRQAAIKFTESLLKMEMPPALFENYRRARENHDYELSMNILKGYFEGKHCANN